MRRAQGKGVGQDHGRDQIEASQRIAQRHDQDDENADRHDEPALDLVVVRERPDIGRLGIGAGDLGRHLDALVFAEKIVQPAAQGQDLVHRVVREHAIGLRHVDPRAMAVGRDVGGEAALELGVVVHCLVVDQEVIEGAAADRIVQDRGHLAVGAAGSVGDLGGTVGGARQLAQQNFLRLLWTLLAGLGRMTPDRASPAPVAGLRSASVAETGEGIVENGQAPRTRQPVGPLQDRRGLFEARGQRLAALACATESSDFGSDAIAGLTGQAQAGFRFEPDGRAQLGRSFGKPLLKLDGPLGKLMKTGVDLAQPRREPGTFERLGASQRLSGGADFGKLPLMR